VGVVGDELVAAPGAAAVGGAAGVEVVGRVVRRAQVVDPVAVGQLGAGEEHPGRLAVLHDRRVAVVGRPRRDRCRRRLADRLAAAAAGRGHRGAAGDDGQQRGEQNRPGAPKSA
jgi:hypothetical protein